MNRKMYNVATATTDGRTRWGGSQKRKEARGERFHTARESDPATESERATARRAQKFTHKSCACLPSFLFPLSVRPTAWQSTALPASHPDKKRMTLYAAAAAVKEASPEITVEASSISSFMDSFIDRTHSIQFRRVRIWHKSIDRAFAKFVGLCFPGWSARLSSSSILLKMLGIEEVSHRDETRKQDGRRKEGSRPKLRAIFHATHSRFLILCL